MKIVQICGLIEGAGITRYMIELNYALKAAGNDVEIYYCQHEDEIKNAKPKWQTIPNVIKYDYSAEPLNHINEADVVCINQLMPVKADAKYREPFMRLITEQITKPKKVFFINGHNVIGYKFYGIELLKDKDFLNSFDRITTFDSNTSLYETIKKTIGEDEAMKKYLYMHHPYHFNEEYINNWLPVSEKAKRVTYIGRWAEFKNPRLVQDFHKIARNDFEFEMRGIIPMIGTAAVPDLFYELNPDTSLSLKERKMGPSKFTEVINGKWIKEHGLPKGDLCLDVPHGNKMFIFGAYVREDGLKAMAKASFGAEFYRLKDKRFYGDNPEYAMIEIIEQGTLPLFDKFTGENIHMYENGIKTYNSMVDLNMGVYLEKDCSNAYEIIEQMNYLINNPNKYDEMRHNCLDIMMKHTDPVSTANKFIEDIFNN